MKKSILICSILAMSTLQSFAQRIKVGPEIGVNFTKLTIDDPTVDNDDLKMKAGLKIGGIVDIGFNRMVSFQPGLFYSMKGTKESYSYNVAGNSRVYVNNTYKINYLEIPMNLQLKFGRPHMGQFFIGAGPYVAFAIGGELESKSHIKDAFGNNTEYDDQDYDLEIGNDANDDDIKGTDAGVNLNLGFMAPRGFFLRANLGIGLANIEPGGDENYSARNLSTSLTAGFLFGR